MSCQETRPVRRPGPDHPISIEPYDGCVTVSVEGRILAQSTNALVMAEASYAPVYYFPRTDVVMHLLTASTHQSYCPYKGIAGYFSVIGERPELTNCVWTYETPFRDVEAIADHLAFYRDRVDIGV